MRWRIPWIEGDRPLIALERLGHRVRREVCPVMSSFEVRLISQDICGLAFSTFEMEL